MRGREDRIPVLVAFGGMWLAQVCFLSGWGWAGLVFTLAGWTMLWTGDRNAGAERGLSTGWQAIIAAGLFALALGLRYYRLGVHPPFWWDEGVQAFDVRSVLAGKPLESLDEIRYHRSPLWNGILAVFVAAFGHSTVAFRGASALAGSAIPVMAFFLGTRMFGAVIGILSGLFLAWHPWLLHQSRMSLGHILTPAMAFVLLLVITSRNMTFRRRGIIAGLIAGVNMYGYAASYHLPFLGLVAMLLVPESGEGRRERIKAAMLVPLIAAAFAVPASLMMHGYWGKTLDVSAGTDLGIIRGNILGAMKMFHMEGDSDMRHWYPAGGPVLGPLLGPLFSLGIGLVLTGRMGEAGVLVLGWLVLGMSPGLATIGGDRNLFRMVGAAPAVAILCSIGGAGVIHALGGRLGIIAVTFMWMVSGWGDVRTYISGYSRDTATSSVFRSYAGEAGIDLAGAAGRGAITICPPLTLARHPIEKLGLFDDIAAGRVAFVSGPCGARGAGKVYRDSFGQPQAVMFRAGGHIEYRTMMDICMEGDRRQGTSARAAGEFFRGWRVIFPDSFVLMERVGFADLKAGKSVEAIHEFRLAVKMGSNLASTWDGLASALFRTGRFGEAEKAIERALQMEPENGEFLKDRETIRKAVLERKTGGK